MQELLWHVLGVGAWHAAPLPWKAPAKVLLTDALATCWSALMNWLAEQQPPLLPACLLHPGVSGC